MDEKANLFLDEKDTAKNITECVMRNVQFTDSKHPSVHSVDGIVQMKEGYTFSGNVDLVQGLLLPSRCEEKATLESCKMSIKSACELEISEGTMDIPTIEETPGIELDLACNIPSGTHKSIAVSESSMSVPLNSSISNMYDDVKNVTSESDRLVQNNTTLGNNSHIQCSIITGESEEDIVEKHSEQSQTSETLEDFQENNGINNMQKLNIVNENCTSSDLENCNNYDLLPCSVQTAEFQNGTPTDHDTQVDFLTNVTKHTGNMNSDINSSNMPTIPLRQVEEPTVRPTLVDDSKLVKILLPANPMNLMSSNTQFLNRSRHFLNFITEKSTNIMEKALLPQHLAIKYAPNIRTTEAGSTKKCMDDSSSINVPFSLTDSRVLTMDELSKKSLANTDTPVSLLQANEKHFSQHMDMADNCTRSTLVNCVVKGTASANEQDDTHFPSNNCRIITSNINRYDVFQETDVPIINEKVNENSVINARQNSDLSPDYTIFNSEENECQSSVDEDSELPQEDSNNIVDADLNNCNISMLQHPAYVTLSTDCANLKERNMQLFERVQSLEKTNKILEDEKNNVFTVQIETLEKTVDRLTSELRLALVTQDVLKREHAAANKERESMVMKYAVGERQLIDTQRAKDYAERKLKETLRDNELLQNKLRQLQGERTRICNILDNKCREVTDLQREVEKLKEEVSRRDIKLKWSQNKLKTEMELQKETQQKLDKALVRINDMREECDQVRRETQESIRKFQMSEENKAVTLDQQLKEKQAQLILERHVTQDKEMLRLQLQREVEVLQGRQQALIEENNTLSLKIQDAEKNRLNYESSVSNLKIIADQRQKEIVDLLAKVSQLETLKLQLQHTEQCLTSLETEIDHLRAQNAELQQDMSACRQREADMLDFTQKLTEKNVCLQSEFTAVEARAKQLNAEQGPLRDRINELTMKIRKIEESLMEEKKKRAEECEILAKHVAEQTQLAQNLAQKLEESQGENAVLKRKQVIGMKEMTRELQQCRKRLEAYEGASPTNSLDVNSRTASNTSLNTGDTLNGALSDNSANADHHTTQSSEPSRQTLIDRIIQLQNINCKRAEKLDFFEENTRTLVEELQKKEKIIQNYILHEHSGALGSNEMDRHKAELAKHGGIMASVYSQKIADNNMTLELSLQINQKQQAVLEDTLLKNITLKNNIDTLSQEIARLTMQIQQKTVAS